eukprot:gene17119-15672_t
MPAPAKRALIQHARALAQSPGTTAAQRGVRVALSRTPADAAVSWGVVVDEAMELRYGPPGSVAARSDGASGC